MQASGGGSLAEGSSVDGEGSLDGQARHARSARSSQALEEIFLAHCLSFARVQVLPSDCGCEYSTIAFEEFKSDFGCACLAAVSA